MQVFTIGSGRNGTKTMSIVLGTVFEKSFHEYKMIPTERRRAFFNMKWMGPKLKAKVQIYKKFKEFHDADNCNTYFMHHLCRIFPSAKVLLPIGPMHSFIRAHRVWGLMEKGDVNVHTRAYPKDDRRWDKKPVVVRLAWLWGMRNIQAIKRSDPKRLMVFRIKELHSKLPDIFKFIGKPLNDRALNLSKIRHNKLEWDESAIDRAEQEIRYNIEEIIKVARPFKSFISGWV